MYGFSTHQANEIFLLGGLDPEQAEGMAARNGSIALVENTQGGDDEAAGMREGHTRRLGHVTGSAKNHAKLVRAAAKHGARVCEVCIDDIPCWLLRPDVTVVFSWGLLSEKTRRHLIEDLTSPHRRARVVLYGKLREEEERALAGRGIIVWSNLTQLLEFSLEWLIDAGIITEELIPLPDEPEAVDLVLHSPLPETFLG